MSEQALEQAVQSPAEESTSNEQPSADQKAEQSGEKSAPSIGEVQPRDEQGRFAKVRASLAKAKYHSEYVQAVQAGAIQLTDDLDPQTWRAAREAQIRNGTAGITPPELPEEQGQQQGAKPGGTAQPELSPEVIKSFQAHDDFMGSLAAKMAVDPATRTAMTGFRGAVERGLNRDAVAYMGVLIAGTDNPHEVFQALGSNPDVIQTYSRLSPDGMAVCIKALSQEITKGKAVFQKPPKPAPPAPVGARAASSAFDVSDEKLSPEEWMQQRNRQVADRRKRGY